MNLHEPLRNLLRKQMTDGWACAERHPIINMSWGVEVLGGLVVTVSCAKGEFVEVVRVDQFEAAASSSPVVFAVASIERALEKAKVDGRLRHYVVDKKAEEEEKPKVQLLGDADRPTEKSDVELETEDANDAWTKRAKLLEID